MDWQQILFAIGIVALASVPAIWLYRDASRRGKDAKIWVILYIMAAAPPRLRYVLVPILFLVYLLLRDATIRMPWPIRYVQHLIRQLIRPR